jgi:dynein heavy chain
VSFTKSVSLVSRSLQELSDFIKVTSAALSKPLKEGDYAALVTVMGHLQAVKERQQKTDEMFEPLKQTIELLKTFNQEMPEDVHKQLQVRVKVTFGSRLSVTVTLL